MTTVWLPVGMLRSSKFPSMSVEEPTGGVVPFKTTLPPMIASLVFASRMFPLMLPVWAKAAAESKIRRNVEIRCFFIWVSVYLSFAAKVRWQYYPNVNLSLWKDYLNIKGVNN